MYYVSSSPHVKAKLTTNRIMIDVVIAMIPAALFGIINSGMLFGGFYAFRAFILIAVAIGSCVLSEYIYNKIIKREQTIGDMSAVVTGMILALNLPVTFPIWMTILGSVFAIIVVKQLFGGLGQNFMNPALGARCFLVLSFAKQMTAFFPVNVDAVSSATPLTMLKNGADTDLLTMFIGNHAGTIGETSVIALLIGALYLTVRNIIDLRIPLTYIGVFAVCILLFGGQGFDSVYMLKHICGGGLIFGAFYMATDYSTSPITTKGKYLYGICLGVLTALFRTFGNTAEGVSFAIIFCNLLVPLIENITIPKAFGLEKEKEA